MLYSLDFIVLFLPSILFGFFLIKRVCPYLCAVYLLTLLYAALYFIDVTSFIMVLVTSTINYLLVRRIYRQKKPMKSVSIGVICALLPLILFKFYPSLFQDVKADSSILFTVGIPIGLSFYALQQITALLDSRAQATDLLPYHKHLLYLGFFPNFIAGPVFFFRDAVKPIASLGYKPIPTNWIGNGLLLFFVGLCKKLWIADPLGGAINHIISNIQAPTVNMSLVEGWFVIWGFLVQLYFDFSAYSDMAIGLAMCFGIILPMNFDSPLKATSAQEYIARWHMSFTRFVREYFFIPSLGLLKKLPIKNTEKKMSFTWGAGLFLSYIVIGVWHAPNLIVMAASTVVILILFFIKLPSLMSTQVTNTYSTSRMSKYVNRIFLLLFSMLMAICLKVEDGYVLVEIYSSLLRFDTLTLPYYTKNFVPLFLENFVSFTGFAPLLNDYSSGYVVFINKKTYFILLLIASGIIFFSPNTMTIFGIKNSQEKYSFEKGSGVQFYLVFLVLFCIVIFALLFESNQIQNFIYEQF